MPQTGLTGGIGAGKCCCPRRSRNAAGIVVDGDVSCVKWSSRAPRAGPLVDAFRWSRHPACRRSAGPAGVGVMFRDDESRAVCLQRTAPAGRPAADPRSSRRFRDAAGRRYSTAGGISGWRHCFAGGGGARRRRATVRRLVEQRGMAEADARQTAQVRATSSVVPSPTSGWTTRAAQR